MKRAAGILILAGSLWITKGAPEVRKLSPLALPPGRAVTLTFQGEELNGATMMWNSFGAPARRLDEMAGPTQAAFEVTLPPAASGIGAVQLISTNGSSKFHLLAIDPLEAQQLSEPGQSRAKAHRLSPPCAVDARTTAESRDFYVFSGKAGQRYSIEIIAHRIGSQLDSVVRVLDENDRELAFHDDEPGTSRDTRFQITCPVTADYYLLVHDMGYGGGEEFFYRLRLGDFPIESPRYPLNYPADAPTVLEQEPNDSAAQARQFAFPSLLHGQLQHGQDVDQFRFLALKDQRIRFKGMTRSLGVPADLALRLRKEDGTILARSDQTGLNEGTITHTVKEPGIHLLEIRELSGTAGPGLPYVVRAENFKPSFELQSSVDQLQIKPGGSATIKVTARRTEHSAAVELALEPSVEGITLENNVVPQGKNEVDLKVNVSEQWHPGTAHHFRLVGTAEGSRVGSSTAPALKARFPLLLYPAAALDGIHSITITSP